MVARQRAAAAGAASRLTAGVLLDSTITSDCRTCTVPLPGVACSTPL
jgi:hypothetical protein